jgi:hypothetical protein
MIKGYRSMIRTTIFYQFLSNNFFKKIKLVAKVGLLVLKLMEPSQDQLDTLII